VAQPIGSSEWLNITDAESDLGCDSPSSFALIGRARFAIRKDIIGKAGLCLQSGAE
jgi:hypothetical protein